MADLKMEIKETPEGPVLISRHGDFPATEYHPATSVHDLKAKVDQAVNGWIQDRQEGA